MNNNYEELYEQFNNGKSLAEIARENNLVRQTITNNFIKLFNYKPVKKSRVHESITDEVINEIHLKYINGASLSGLSKEYNISRKFITKKLKELEGFDVNNIPINNKLKVNSNYFSDINTEAKAYWLGLLYADGYVGNNGSIELCLKDKEHVLKFKNALDSDHKIGEKKTSLNEKNYISYRINITDTKLNEDLQKHGCHSNKSLSIKIPDLDKNLISHFIRGFFDGDGTIGIYGNRSQVRFSCASDDMISDLVLLLSSLNIDTSIYADKRSKVKTLVINKVENRVSFLNWMYNNSCENTRLNRKYDKTMEVLNYHSERKVRRSCHKQMSNK